LSTNPGELRFQNADNPNVEVRIPKALASGNAYSPLQKLIADMSLAEFIDTFGWIWDQATGQFVPFQLWPMQRVLADIMDAAKVLWMPKGRQLGGSEMTAMKAIKIAIEENGAQIIVVSKGETEAKYFLSERIKKKMLPLMAKMPQLPWPAVDPYTQICYVGPPPGVGESDTRSYIESLPSDPDAGRGRTLRYVIMDEAKTIEAADKIFNSLFPTIDNNPRGQMVVLSNSGNGTWANGRFKAMWDRCRQELGRDTGTLSDGNVLFFMPATAHPKHDEAWKKRSIATLGSELAHYTENPETMEHFFLSPEGKVIPSFEKKEGGLHVRAMKPDFTWKFFIIYDHGYTHPAVLTFALYNEYEDHVHIFRSMYWYQKYIDLIAADIKVVMADMLAHAIPPPSRQIADGAIFNKTGQASRTVGEVLRDEAGISFDRAHKYDEAGALQLVNKRFRTGKITIDPSCVQLINQLDSWVYDKNGNPKDADNDGPDTLRYLEAELYQQDRPKEAPKPKPYQRLAMKRKALMNGGISQAQGLTPLEASRAWLSG
jgi:hypothetical protein